MSDADADDSDTQEPLIDVPDDFDLHDARQAHSTTPADEKPRCPNCGRMSIDARVGSIAVEKRWDDPDYYCRECGTMFDEPVYADSYEEVRDDAE